MIIDNIYIFLAIYLGIKFDYLGRINIFNFAKQLPRPAMNFETELSNTFHRIIDLKFLINLSANLAVLCVFTLKRLLHRHWKTERIFFPCLLTRIASEYHIDVLRRISRERVHPLAREHLFLVKVKNVITLLRDKVSRHFFYSESISNDLFTFSESFTLL